MYLQPWGFSTSHLEICSEAFDRAMQDAEKKAQRMSEVLQSERHVASLQS